MLWWLDTLDRMSYIVTPWSVGTKLRIPWKDTKKKASVFNSATLYDKDWICTIRLNLKKKILTVEAASYFDNQVLSLLVFYTWGNKTVQ